MSNILENELIRGKAGKKTFVPLMADASRDKSEKTVRLFGREIPLSTHIIPLIRKAIKR